MRVKTNEDGKVYIMNTDCCDVELPDEYLGTNLSKYVYTTGLSGLSGEWHVDPHWTSAEQLLGVESPDVQLLYNMFNQQTMVSSISAATLSANDTTMQSISGDTSLIMQMIDLHKHNTTSVDPAGMSITTVSATSAQD